MTALPPPDGTKTNHQGEGGGRPRSFETEAELRTKIGKYITEWEDKSRPLTMAGLCVNLRISKETLSLYMSGHYDTNSEKFSDATKEAKLYIEMCKLEKGLTGDYNSHIAKFDLTNNHGYKEKIEQSGDPDNPISYANVNWDDPVAAHKAWQESLREDD